MRKASFGLAALLGWAAILVSGAVTYAQAPPPAYTEGGELGEVPPPPKNRVRLDIDVGVPLYLTTGRLDPGVAGAAQIGYDFGFIVPLVRFGYAWSPLNVDFPNEVDMHRISASLGARFELGGEGPVLLYATPMVDLDIWHASGTIQMPNCASWFCSLSGDDWDASPGFSLQLGTDFRPTGADHFGFGFGLRTAVTFATGPLPHPAAFLVPYLRASALF
jgi:hypothetical protein